MKRHNVMAVLLAAPLAACAPVQAEDSPSPAGSTDPSSVPVFYVGQKPQCGMRRLTEIQASSLGGLRVAALQVRGNAVVAVRSRLVVVEASRAAYRRAITGPAAIRVYEGMAARIDDRCHA
jgi:hypothetical protein